MSGLATLLCAVCTIGLIVAVCVLFLLAVWDDVGPIIDYVLRGDAKPIDDGDMTLHVYPRHRRSVKALEGARPRGYRE